MRTMAALRTAFLVVGVGLLLTVTTQASAGRWPSAKFAVMSDIHVYDMGLGVEGQAFEQYVASDRKMIAESAEIAEAAVRAISQSDVDFVLVSGDLTKDGELASHQQVVTILQRLLAAGKRVYVVPGNHDIDNPAAMSFSGGKTTPTQSVSGAGFAAMYGPFGFDGSISRDNASLSYVAEPVPGLWLLALDSCTYAADVVASGDQVTTETPLQSGGGLLSPATKAWVSDVLRRAREQGKGVIAMVHHGVVEHFTSQSLIFSRWLLSDYTEVGRLFASGRVPVVFTGHFHAQDITSRRFTGGQVLVDVETGSLVTYPSPYRMVEIDPGGAMRISTRRVEAIASQPLGFAAYSRLALSDSLNSLADSYLSQLAISKPDRDLMRGPLSEAFRTHFAGDEGTAPSLVPPASASMAPWGRVVWAGLSRTVVRGLTTDINTTDNEATIALPQ